MNKFRLLEQSRFAGRCTSQTTRGTHDVVDSVPIPPIRIIPATPVCRDLFFVVFPTL